MDAKPMIKRGRGPRKRMPRRDGTRTRPRPNQRLQRMCTNDASPLKSIGEQFCKAYSDPCKNGLGPTVRNTANHQTASGSILALLAVLDNYSQHPPIETAVFTTLNPRNYLNEPGQSARPAGTPPASTPCKHSLAGHRGDAT